MNVQYYSYETVFGTFEKLLKKGLIGQNFIISIYQIERL